jgi:thiamine-monophosphate kinase
MKVSELGEFGLIGLLAEMVSTSQSKSAAAYKNLLLGIGDDAAAWKGAPEVQLATTDSLFQDVHFRLSNTPWYELGWKALAVNLSDIAAMGGLPQYALVSLALPPDTEVDDVKAMYRGMLDLAQRFEVALVGGDTCKAPLVSITVTVLGSAGKDSEMLTRSAARPGDKIAVTGSLGGAAASMEMLDKKLKLNSEADTQLRRAFLQPVPRVAEGQKLVEMGVRAAIDISDGLIADLEHVCVASGVGARIEAERIPVAPAVKAHFKDRALELAATEGEDYELLFTANEQKINAVKEALSCPVTIIGEVVAEGPGNVALIGGNSAKVDLGKQGWEHFDS